MHPNSALIRRLFEGLAGREAAVIAGCYDPDARFRDIAFDLHGREQIAAMWRMIMSGDIQVTLDSVEADDETGFARVTDEYTFRETGRRVRNPIQSRFRFRNGWIFSHLDTCDARAWATMAFGQGLIGFVAGHVRFARAFQAGRLLHKFQREEKLQRKPGRV